jgi:NADH:ubiquinone oxidoreductase subunit H
MKKQQAALLKWANCRLRQWWQSQLGPRQPGKCTKIILWTQSLKNSQRRPRKPSSRNKSLFSVPPPTLLTSAFPPTSIIFLKTKMKGRLERRKEAQEAQWQEGNR